MLKLAYNTTSTTVVVDAAGYSIGGRSWGPIDTTDQFGKAELDSGRVVLVDEAAFADTDNPEAAAALQALRDRRDRTEQAQAASKDELVEAVDPDVVARLEVGGDGLPAKDDLVDAAVATDADLEASKKPTTPRRGKK